MNKTIKKINQPLIGHVELSGSKSISNRLLIIQALCQDDFELSDLATADDTKILQEVLKHKSDTYDVHHAGTSYRFLCSFLCLQPGEQVLTGSSRMKERPIGPLVDALRSLGAEIEYLEEEGYPPLKIGEAHWKQLQSPLKIDATISSQFISSLLLIAPALPYGLDIELVGDLVSRPYLEMTLKLMQEFGIEYSWEDQIIRVRKQDYQAKDYTVEADWSAASYYYNLVAMVPDSVISLGGLRPNSIQGDAEIVHMMKDLGVESSFDDGVLILKHQEEKAPSIEIDFILQPDLAQSIAVCCAGLGISGLFTGLQTLKVKETDRIHALQQELMKVQVFLSKLPPKFSKKSEAKYYIQEGKAQHEAIPSFATYKDHRMAMAFACLAANMDVQIEQAAVVSKSYPDFWSDLASLGIEIE